MVYQNIPTRSIYEIMCNLKKIIFITALLCLSLIAYSYADQPLVETQLPNSLSEGLMHLLALVDPGQRVAFDAQRIAPLLEFVKTTKPRNALYYANPEIGSPSAYYDFDIQRSFTDLLKYNFSPDIPAVATTPSSTRLSYWEEIEHHGNKLPSLWKESSSLDAPIVIKGSEVFENTPDTFSGAYYKYDLYRSIIVFAYNRQKVLISISKQKDASRVGNKGYILGSDENWDYYYTGRPGITLPGLGWIRTHMYDSFGISIYHEMDKDAPLLRCAVFKCVRAGWAKINVVKTMHIYDGLLRFSRSFKEIMESPRLPAEAALAHVFSGIRNQPVTALQAKMNIYAQILQKRYGRTRSPSAKWKPEILQNKSHWARMSKLEMQSALVVEYMKSALGKTKEKEVEKLFDLKP